jgi:hypothetical protein
MRAGFDERMAGFRARRLQTMKAASRSGNLIEIQSTIKSIGRPAVPVCRPVQQ